MSQALFERIAQGRHESRSAGTRPAARVHPVVVEALLARECPRYVGSLYLEALVPGKATRKSEVVEQRADGEDFLVVRYAQQLSEADGEEPGSDRMVEEKRFGMLPGKVHCPGHKRRVDHRDPTQDSGPPPHDRRLGCWQHGQLAPLMKASSSRLT